MTGFGIRVILALVANGTALLIAAALLDGLSIEGVLDWIVATVIVWIATLAYDIFDEPLQRLALRGIRPGTAA